MSEPYIIENGKVKDAISTLESQTKLIEEDIEKIIEFKNAVEEMNLQGPEKNNGFGNLVSKTQSKNRDTDKVLELYSNLLMDDESIPETEKISESFNLSYEAADFFRILKNIANYDNESVLQTAHFLDSSNSMSEQHRQLVSQYSTDLASMRENVLDDVPIEQDSLSKYQEDLDEIKDALNDLNTSYKLPVGLDSGIEIVDTFEDIYDRIDQLRNRREHEIRRRPEFADQYLEQNLSILYEEESFDKPVLEELDRLENLVDDAYDNLTVKF